MKKRGCFSSSSYRSRFCIGWCVSWKQTCCRQRGKCNGKIGLAAGPAGALLGAGIGLAVGGVISAVSANRQAKAEKELAQDIAKQQKAAKADQLAINRSSQARQELRDRKRQQYMFQPEDESFLTATGGSSGFDRFMRSKYGA